MNRIPVKQVVKAFGLTLPSMQDMPTLIESWTDLYEGHPSWLSPMGASAKYPNLPAIICYEVARCSASELAVSATDDIAQDVIDNVITPRLQQTIEKVLAQGAVCFRPHFDTTNNKLRIDTYPADCFMPLDFRGHQIVSGAFIDRKEVIVNDTQRWCYTKVEVQQLTGNVINVRTKLFRREGSFSPSELGIEVSLDSVPAWAGITPEFTIANVDRPLFVYAASPWDPKGVRIAGLGAAIFADGEDLIQSIVESYNALTWEVESGRRAMVIADSAIPTDATGRELTDTLTKRLYRKMDVGGSADAAIKDMFADFSPDMRVEPIISTLKLQLGLASLACHMDSGFFQFDQQTGAVTAKEITVKEKKSYGTVCAVQSTTIEPTICALIHSCATVLDLYDQQSYDADKVVEELTIAWGDSLMSDADTERSTAILEVQSGLRSIESYLREFRGMSEQDAQAESIRIRDEAKASAPVDFFGGA